MSVVESYALDILQRARVPMEPLDYEVDWFDQPRRHKVYPGTVRIPLPVDRGAGRSGSGRAAAGEVSAGEVPDGAMSGEETGAFDLGALASMLRDSYGINGRRMAIHGNDDVAGLPSYPRATWSRGTASGGGLYPVEIYLVTSGTPGLAPGVYNYSSAHHALSRLGLGDVTGAVRSALPEGAPTAGHYLLLSVKFWKNSFKYNSFSYHVVAMDVGTILGTWRLWADANRLPCEPVLWFDEPALNTVTGVDGVRESVFAVVPLPWAGDEPGEPAARATGAGSAGPSRAPGPAVGPVRTRENERSVHHIAFEQVEAVQAAVLRAGRRPEGSDTRAAAPRPDGSGRRVQLPEPREVTMPLRQALRRRRSSFGRFAEDPPLALADLHTLLRAGGAAAEVHRGPFGSDTAMTRVAVVANHVEGLPAGAYDFDPGTGTLVERTAAELGALLQRVYFLQNYNLEQAAAVLVVVGRPRAAVRAYGPRGYRLMNAHVGAVAQYLYTTAAGLHVGCGAALGFDNVTYRELLGLAGTSGEDEEWPLLIAMVGHERTDHAEFLLSLRPDTVSSEV
jgi:SagB-type dehydrogenase family enzyme